MSQKFILKNYDEVKEMNKSNYIKLLKALEGSKYDEFDKIWRNAKIIAIIHKNVTDWTAEDAHYELEILKKD